MTVVLASQSPRRRELLGQMGFTDFVIRPAKGEEVVDPGLLPDKLVEELSRQKCEEVAAASGADDLIIAADTVVAIDGTVLGKPRSVQDAFAMLSRLSGRHHTVYTGVTVRRGEKTLTAHEATRVHFRPLTAQEIEDYISTGEPMDKAGSYGIQGGAALFCSHMVGDYYNVMGLPVCRLGQTLKRIAPEIQGEVL